MTYRPVIVPADWRLVFGDDDQPCGVLCGVEGCVRAFPDPDGRFDDEPCGLSKLGPAADTVLAAAFINGGQPGPCGSERTVWLWEQQGVFE